MAIIDQALLFEDGATLTTSRVGTSVIDFSQLRDMGTKDSPLKLSIRFPTLPTAAGAATIQFVIMTSSDNSTFVTLVSSGVVAYTAFTAAAPWGPWRLFPFPSGNRRYVRLDWTVGTGPLTAGTVLAGLSTEVEFGNINTYAKAYVA